MQWTDKDAASVGSSVSQDVALMVYDVHCRWGWGGLAPRCRRHPAERDGSVGLRKRLLLGEGVVAIHGASRSRRDHDLSVRVVLLNVRL